VTKIAFLLKDIGSGGRDNRASDLINVNSFLSTIYNAVFFKTPYEKCPKGAK